jgi:hypothetical protein
MPKEERSYFVPKWNRDGDRGGSQKNIFRYQKEQMSKNIKYEQREEG